MEKEIGWLLNEKYHGEKTSGFFQDVKRIAGGEPADYVIGFTNFLGCKIDLSFHPLIPRVETEFLMEKAMKQLPEKFSSLDIFAGSGCIGIALLKQFPEASVDFADVNPYMALQIEKNLAENNCFGKVFVSDVFENIPLKRYDFIFANPPYISQRKIDRVQSSVLMHEPHLALFADDDGLFFIKKLLNEPHRYLAPKGKLFIEFDEWQRPAIEAYCQNKNLPVEFWKDQYEAWRMAVVY